ncbi:hypothetical protein KIF53_17645 [Chromobacterium subtsugae]|uniref:DUF86 domain-containing protein n=1 Tax=Chromobacterium subtsugae TaxID=251747 RepID=A0ABS7FH93_9NEIS|nr:MULTISPECIES: hypothetical protein [Chromobacterium]KUM03690.1 hypothetical protein Cv017_00860 [Chromobacterium subtsugae]KZE88326.1 hypothetical protein AWB61_00130 [Chromobacterium sp. F49]MBW7568709.1 hypothetical protein [Chromobacterium subtsugae]MBW8289461.1 hypothetical protein [Chromobacterium subtsugae]OBU85914.1 hypothetical protein MY55_13955 [Chromobacterium subtsugae]
MRKIQAVLKDIAQKTLLLASLIDEATRVGVLSQEQADDLVQGVRIRGHLSNSLETMAYWTAKDLNDPALAEEFQELVISIRDFLAWVDETVGKLQAALHDDSAVA